MTPEATATGPNAGGLRLSVVIPVLNEEAELSATLDALAGPGAPEEILVVDGGSHDRTRDLARAAGARVLSAPRGRGSQLAAGAAAATGELLLFLHADARLEAGSLPALRRAFEDPGLQAAGCTQRVLGEGRVYRGIERAANARVRRFGLVYGDSGLAVRRSVYEAVGGFAPLPIFEDVDLSRRLRRKAPVVLLEDVRLAVSARRWEAEGAIWRTARNWLLTLAYWLGVPPGRLARFYRPQEAAAPSLPVESSS